MTAQVIFFNVFFSEKDPYLNVSEHAYVTFYANLPVTFTRKISVLLLSLLL